MTIDRAFEILQTFEGGDKLTNNPDDAGSTTKFGISKTSYPNLDIAKLTESQAKAIYGTDYWLKANCQKLKAELQYLVFDTAVNCGTGTAVRLLQEAAGVAPDGVFGAQTLVKSDTVSFYEYMLLRQWRYNDIVLNRKNQLVFLGGWDNRNKAILKLYKTGGLL